MISKTIYLDSVTDAKLKVILQKMKYRTIQNFLLAIVEEKYSQLKWNIVSNLQRTKIDLDINIWEKYFCRKYFLNRLS